MMLSIPTHNTLKVGKLMISQLKDLSWPQSFGVFLFFLGGVCPGFLIIQMYKPELIIELDTLKLILFCISLSFPIVLLNFIFSAFLFHEEEKKKEEGASLSDDEDNYLFGSINRNDRYDQASFSFLLTAIVLYPSLLFAYYNQGAFILFVILVIVIETLLIAFAIGDYCGQLFKAKALKPLLERFKKKDATDESAV